MKTLNNKRGFTLVELVIALAIAALIIAGVLLAVSGAQKSRRDAQRKNDVARILANVETYASNHGGVYPAAIPAATYAGMTDPKSGGAYVPTATRTNPGDFTYVQGGATTTACDGTAMTGARQFKVAMRLESTDDACVDTK